MEKQIVVVNLDPDNSEYRTMLLVSHPNADNEQFVRDWDEANDTVVLGICERINSDNSLYSTDEATVHILEEKGYLIKYVNFIEVNDG